MRLPPLPSDSSVQLPINILYTASGAKDDKDIVLKREDALRTLAHLYMQCFDIPKIAVIGTVGKSSTVEILRYIFGQKFNSFRAKVFIHEPQNFVLMNLNKNHQVALIKAASGVPDDYAYNSYVVDFDRQKIYNAIHAAAQNEMTDRQVNDVTNLSKHNSLQC